MKKTILFTAILAVGLNLTSCEDFLSEDNPNKIPVENYFTTENDVERAVYGAYNGITFRVLYGRRKYYVYRGTFR